jgi:uncharacterized membrane protein YidH (DUF202 family)
LGKRFWLAWAACLVAIVVGYLAVGQMNPPTEIASAGTEVPRSGIPTFIMIVPLVLGAFRLRKYDDLESPVFYALPAVLAAGLLLAGLAAGYLPDDPPGCASIGVDPREFPDCFTTSEVRSKILMELAVVWVCFGLLALLLGYLKSRRSIRRRVTG